MSRFTFRTRVLLYLVLFAVIPSTLLMVGGAVVVSSTLPVLSASKAWDNVANTGRRAIDAARQAPLTSAQRAAVDAHERELAASLVQAKRVGYLTSRIVVLVIVTALLGSLLVALLASRVAGHLSRQLSRPLGEIVAWADHIARGEPLPAGPPRRGAPEFELLRQRMRAMAADLEAARTRDREASRLEAFRETARRVAHELKNPLTPIRLAVARLKRDSDPRLVDVVDVLETESRRLEEMARNFAQFGRLPEGPPAAVDVGELARYAARAIATDRVPVRVSVEEDVPLVTGHYDALARALSNVLMNAVDACRDGGDVAVRVARAHANGNGVVGDAVELCVRDTGLGIAPDALARIWDPYVTQKPGGTGLGLAIARQTVLAHGGTVDATSRPGEGTEIRLVLPINETPAAPALEETIRGS
ncbi:MAG TPA: HAMP domain-containing sensor histidine kinase [Gemmatimonadaceae bacterium]|nr:HAMP domain-containing sensor histidine kinase [Gemmatimonadaceae bacterium]